MLEDTFVDPQATKKRRRIPTKSKGIVAADPKQRVRSARAAQPKRVKRRAAVAHHAVDEPLEEASLCADVPAPEGESDNESDALSSLQSSELFELARLSSDSSNEASGSEF
jgi:hypothetical protein